MLNYISIEETAKELHLSEQEVHRILMDCQITPLDWHMTAKEAASFLRRAYQLREEPEVKAMEYLRRNASQRTVFIDTCSLLRAEFPAFLAKMLPLLKENGRTLMVPSAVRSELVRKLYVCPELRETIVDVLDLLAEQQEAGLVQLYGDAHESFADQQILTTAIRSRQIGDVLFITQDADLAQELLQVNNFKSISGYRIEVARVNQYGYLSRIHETVQAA